MVKLNRQAARWTGKVEERQKTKEKKKSEEQGSVRSRGGVLKQEQTGRARSF